VTHDQHDLQRSTQLSKMTGEEVAELFRLLQSELRGQLSAGASASDLRDGLALKLETLEAELRGLRQVLTEVKANPDEPRRKTDELRPDRGLAERRSPTQTRAEGRAWFCGRAAAH
jgi:hypothetical protein